MNGDINLTIAGLIHFRVMSRKDFPGSSVVKNLPANAGDTGEAGLIPGLGGSLGVGNGNLLQYSCLGNPMDRGSWWVSLWGRKELDMTE